MAITYDDYPIYANPNFKKTKKTKKGEKRKKQKKKEKREKKEKGNLFMNYRNKN